MRVDCMSLVVNDTEMRSLADIFDRCRDRVANKYHYSLTSWCRALYNMMGYCDEYCIVFDHDDITVLIDVIQYIIADTETGFGRYLKSLLATQLNEFLGRLYEN